MLLRRTLAQLLAAAALLPTGLSAQARRPLTRIAFGSCAEQADSQPIWELAGIGVSPNARFAPVWLKTSFSRMTENSGDRWRVSLATM